MKNTFRISALLLIASALLFSCQKEIAVEPVDNDSIVNTDNSGSRIRTFTCTIADNPDSKVSIDGTGKTEWKVDDEIMIHGGANGAGRLLIKLTAADISADGKQATISFSESDLAPYIHSDSNILSHYYAQYPASCVPSGNMYYECCFTNTNNFLMAACDVDDTFVFYNLCSVITYTVNGDFDKVVFFGNNGERVGYDYYQVRVRHDKSGMVLNYHKPGNGFATYNAKTVILDNSITANETTVNYLSFPNGANFPNGFTFLFYKDGVGVKTVSTHTAVNLARNDFLPLGSLTSHLKDYTPTYTVVGDNASVFGSEWDTFAADNVMTNNGDGTYSKSYNIPAGTYNFKIVKDHSYDLGQWPYDHNQEYIAAKAGKLTIKFKPSDNSITFGFVEAATYTVAGDNNAIFGTAWDQNNNDNNMTLQPDDTFVWSKDITGITTPLSIEFKIIKDHDWSTAWPSSNATFSIPCDGTLYIYFNPTNGDVTSRFVPKITIDGDMSEWNHVSTGASTPDNICKEMKVMNDDTNFYIYLKCVRGSRTDFWGQGCYYYIDFDLDNDASKGHTESSGHNDGMECYMYFKPFGGSAEAPEIYVSPEINPSYMTASGIVIKGVVSGTGETDPIEIELSIPRANLPATPVITTGSVIRVVSWRSKDGSKIELTYTLQ